MATITAGHPYRHSLMGWRMHCPVLRLRRIERGLRRRLIYQVNVHSGRVLGDRFDLRATWWTRYRRWQYAGTHTFAGLSLSNGGWGGNSAHSPLSLMVRPGIGRERPSH